MKNSRKLLIIGFVWPEPKSSAAGRRMMQLISLFRKNGFAVTFATTAQNLEFSEDLSALDIATAAIELNSSTFDDFIKELQPNIVVFDRFMVEEQFGWRVAESCPGALKILNTEDLHCLRHERQLAVKQKRVFEVADLFSSDVAKREIASILRCDLSLMVSEFEMELLQNQFKIDKQLLYHLPIFAERLNELPKYEERTDFVFIGNFLHDPNWDAVKYLSESVWPLIHSQLPDVKMRVYGAYASPKAFELHRPKNNFHIMGRADDASEAIKKAKAVLAPIRFGAGIKGKLLEAMQCGTPSVTSCIGAEAMAGNLEWNGFVKNGPVQFADAAVALYLDEALWHISQQNGFEILEKRYERSIFETDFMAKVASVSKNLPEHRQKNFMGALIQHQTLSATKYMSKWIEEKNKKK